MKDSPSIIDMPVEEVLERFRDGRLSAADLAALSALLKDNAEYRRTWCDLTIQTRSYAKLLDLPMTSRSDFRSVWHSRIGIGLAALLALSLCTYFFRPKSQTARLTEAAKPLARLISFEEGCWRSGDGGEVQCSVGDLIELGDLVRTKGQAASATVQFDDGTQVVLAGQTSATFRAGQGKLIELHQGNLAAEVKPQPDARPMRIETSDASIKVVGTELTVSFDGRTTVGVDKGEVEVTDKARFQKVEVRAGQDATISDAAPTVVQQQQTPQNKWLLDLSHGLPADWQTGSIVNEVDGKAFAVLAAPTWIPFHKRTHFQIATSKAWTTGLFALNSDSVLRFTYRIEKPGLVQVLLVAREGKSPLQKGLVYDFSIPAKQSKAGQWQTAAVHLRDFHAIKKRVPVETPLVFTVIWDTQLSDLGLKISEASVQDQ